jgi:S-adenosylmethionine:tRNA ribosyltransferase-isomerase
MYGQAIPIDDYDYPLPDERIARYPPKKRGDSRWLIYKNGAVSAHRFGEPEDALPPGSILVFNDAKVIPARLFFQTESGKNIEIFCLRPYDTDYERALGRRGNARWVTYVGGAKKWKTGMARWENKDWGVTAEVIGRENDARVVAFEWQPADRTFGELLDAAGRIPIPPYLGREAESVDGERYQTCYAQTPGAVAAPTAGLHFTPEFIERLEKRGVKTAWLTLFVGAGTFKPVTAANALQHPMHAEHFTVSEETVETLAYADGPIVAVGTTVMRTLESLWQMLAVGKRDVGQFPVSVAAERRRLAQLGAVSASTRLMIAPGYRFGLCDALITNFHQPRSTLLLLVAAFIGSDWKKVYQFALNNDFKFLSYGDSSLLWKNTDGKNTHGRRE